MWGKLQNLNKWKEMAVDMVAPRTHAEGGDSGSDDSDEGGHNGGRRLHTGSASGARRVIGSAQLSDQTLTPTHPSSATTRLRGAGGAPLGSSASSSSTGATPPPARGVNAPLRTLATIQDPHLDLSERIMALESELTVSRERNRILQTELETERGARGIAGKRPLGTAATASGSSSLNASLSNIAQALMGGGEVDANASQQQLQKMVEENRRLSDRITQLETDHNTMVAQMQQYSADVKRSHDATVDHYERRLQAQQEELHERMVQFEASKRKMTEQLVSENDDLGQRMGKLKETNSSLEQQLKATTGELQQLKLQQQQEAAHHHPSQREDLDVLQSALRKSEEQRRQLEATVAEMQAANHKVHEELHSAITEAAAERLLLEQRVHQLTDSLTQALHSKQSALDELQQKHDREMKEQQQAYHGEQERHRSSTAKENSASKMHAEQEWNATIHTLTEEMHQLGQHAEMERRTNEAHKQHVESEHAKMISQLQERLTLVESERQQLQATCESLRRLTTSLSEEKHHAASSEADHATFLGALEEANRAAASSNERLRVIQAEYEARGAALERTEVQLSAANESSKRMSERIASLEHDLADKTTTIDAIATAKGMIELDLAKQVSAFAAETERAMAAENAVSQLNKTMGEDQEKLKKIEQSNEQLHRQLSAVQQELELLQRSKDVERSKRAHEEQNITTLRETNEELDAECSRLRGQHQALLTILVEGFQKANLALPQSPTGRPSLHAAELTTLLLSEFHKLHQGMIEAHRVHAQWEQTYNQAKEVNGSLSNQIKELQRVVVELRSDVLQEERMVQALQERAKEESGRWQEAQVSISAQFQTTQRAEDEKRQLTELLNAALKGKEDAEERARKQVREVEHLREALQDKEDEHSTALRAADNLQMVLEQFQRGKQREIEERTMYLQHEIETLKSEVVKLEALKEKHKDDMEMQSRAFRKDLASKNVVITSLQSKLTEMKKILEETAAQLSDEHMIDKRVVSHLVVNFVNSVALKRGDEEDMLKVMSGLLNWDEMTQQKAGLLPGPLNPKNYQNASKSLVGGLVRSVWGAAARKQSHSAGSASSASRSDLYDASQQPPPRSIAEMWVEFLLKEGEQQQQQPNNGDAHGGVDDSADIATTIARRE